METARKIVAAIVGLLVIIVLVLLARWVGDRIRERFAKPTSTVSNMETTATPNLPIYTPVGTTQTATYSAIPQTGPSDFLYPVLAFFFVSGAGTLLAAKRLAA